MITQVKVGQKYVNISIAITDTDGKPMDIITAQAKFLKISQEDGSLNLDTNIKGTGIVTLAKQCNISGFYGVSIETEILSEAEYVILIEVTAQEITTIAVEYLSIDLSKKLIQIIKDATEELKLSAEERKLIQLNIQSISETINTNVETLENLCGEMKNQLNEAKLLQEELQSQIINLNNLTIELQNQNTELGNQVTELQDQAIELKDITENIKSIEFGKWKIEGTQMKFYNENNEVIAIFNLYDKDGNLTSDPTKIVERRKI
jgi:hypothetical protein